MATGEPFVVFPGVATIVGDRLTGKVTVVVIAAQAESVVSVFGEPRGAKAKTVTVTYLVT